MKITAVHLYTMKIPLLTPFKTALRTVENMENVVVTLETDEGALGFGEAPPTAVITGDTIPSIAGAIRDFLAPKILGREVTNADEMHDAIEGAMVHNTSAKAAVEMAVYDLIGKKWGIPLYKLLGGARESLETDITISVNDVDTMVADSLAACSRGFRILKVKGAGFQKRVAGHGFAARHAYGLKRGHIRKRRDQHVRAGRKRRQRVRRRQAHGRHGLLRSHERRTAARYDGHGKRQPGDYALSDDGSRRPPSRH